MKIKQFRHFACDFETTVYKGQTHTEVWASASVELFTEDVHIFHSIREQFEYFKSLKCNVVGYYHNLKFDGNFWLPYLMIEEKLKQAYVQLDEDGLKYEWLSEKDMPNNSFKYSISDMGQWYTIIIKVNNHIIEFRDSLKLLPFSLKRIGESFKTKHQKLEMEYEGFRFSGCNITDEEKKYISNDVLVLKEALEIMYNEGHSKLTIGSCCLEEFKKTIGKDDYEMFFPNLQDVIFDDEKYPNADAWIRKSYRGGWCYLVKGKENQLKKNGTTADVNSLYPSMMSSESGNRYPVGKPCFWKGNFIPPQAIAPNKYYFVRIKTRFYLKRGKLPFIQIKGNSMYDGTEMLETSDIWNSEYNRYYRYYERDGQIFDTRVELTITMTDYELIKEHYELVDFEIIDGCWFFSEIGLFDQYIEKYKQQKLNSKGALRELAKLFLNNLYGKLASSDNSSFKVAYLKEDLSIGFIYVAEHNKDIGYIAIGSAITSYARNFTIRCAQQNYYGEDKRGFIYADTDSIHCDLQPNELKGLTIHDKNFCCWKLEGQWDVGLFVRQKTYIEHITHEDMVEIEEPYYNVRCAGMPEKCKHLFIKSMVGFDEQESDKYNEEELEFLRTKRELTDFKVGLKITGKLMPKRIRGGVLLVDTTYEMR